MIGAIINLFYPNICLACGKKMNEPKRNICDDCFVKIKERVPPFCQKCGRRIKEPFAPDAICPDCRRDKPYFDRAWSACYYDGALKNLIHDFKYKKIASLSEDFKVLMVNFMKKHRIGIDCHLILPIPMHPSRVFAREFNHSDIMAKAIGKCLGIPYSLNSLRKIKNTALQSRLKRNARIENLRSSFFLKNIHAVRGKNILLVDDLFTTGSTINECSRVLKDAGANRVEAITLARGDLT